MKFDSVDSSICKNDICLASKKLAKLLIELGIRESNYNIGSGLGGNNFQLLTLIQMHHHLDPFTTTARVVGNIIFWGVNFLIDTQMKQIRYELNVIFNNISDDNKINGISLHANVSNSMNLVDSLRNSKHSGFGLQIVSRILSGESIDLSSYFYSNQVVIACILCAELATDLDSNINSKIRIVGLTIQKMEPEIILLSVRKCIGIERIIKHNLDLNPYWEVTLYKVNKIIDEEYK